MEEITPIDNDELRDSYQSRGFGTCGPAVVAVMFNRTVQDIIDNWSQLYRGFCSFKELQLELEKYGWKSERVESWNKRVFMIPDGAEQAVCLIKWKEKYSKWPIAEKNTHFIILRKTDNGVRVFCNSVGWVDIDHKKIKEHLKKGKAKAYLI